MNIRVETQPLLSRPGHLVDYFDAKLFVPRGHFDEEHLLAGGKPEGHVLDTFAKFVKPGDTVLDIGANIGTHTFALAALVGNEGLVYAVEADVDNVASIRTSLEQSQSANIRLLGTAAADRIGLIHAMATHRTNTTFSANASRSEVKVACTVPLDDLITEKITFAKLDIEGAELLALLGMKRIIETHRPIVLLEFSPKYIENALGIDRSIELFDFFSTKNYGCFYLDPYRVLHPCGTLEDLIRRHSEALGLFGWHHIDIVFVPTENPIDAEAVPAIEAESPTDAQIDTSVAAPDRMVTLPVAADISSDDFEALVAKITKRVLQDLRDPDRV